MDEQINNSVKNIMDLFTNLIFTQTSKITNLEYENLKHNISILKTIVETNKIKNPNILEFINITTEIYHSYYFSNSDSKYDNIFDTDFMILYNSYAKLKILSTKIYNNKYNTRKL